ncbi:MAG TPA: hypothetical protein VNT55_08990, partial [Baekduia sp.]|nr:hypothetical protein [Baekduia sp.]
MRRALVLLLTLVALVVVAAGCGGGDGGDDGGSSASGGSATPATKAQYREQVKHAGQSLQKTFADISDQTGADTTPANVGAALDKGVAALDQTVEQFKKITPPKGAESAHQKLVEGFSELADAFRESASAARKNDTKSLNKAL